MRILVVLMTLFVGACATSMPANTVFQSGSTDALIIVDQSLTTRYNSLILEGVDLEAQTFSGPRRLISLAERNRVDGGTRGMDLYLGTVPPGLYALAGFESVSISGRMAECFSRGAIVIEAVSGRGNLISRNNLRIGSASDGDASAGPIVDIALRSAEQVLSELPQIAPDLEIARAEQIERIRWSRETTMEGILVGEICPQARNFEVISER